MAHLEAVPLRRYLAVERRRLCGPPERISRHLPYAALRRLSMLISCRFFALPNGSVAFLLVGTDHHGSLRQMRAVASLTLPCTRRNPTRSPPSTFDAWHRTAPRRACSSAFRDAEPQHDRTSGFLCAVPHDRCRASNHRRARTVHTDLAMNVLKASFCDRQRISVWRSCRARRCGVRVHELGRYSCASTGVFFTRSILHVSSEAKTPACISCMITIRSTGLAPESD